MISLREVDEMQIGTDADRHVPACASDFKVFEGTSRTLELAIPPVEMTAEQAKVFQEIYDYAKEKGVNFITRIIE